MTTSGLSNFLETKLLDHVNGKASYTMPTNIYMALLTVAPSNATTEGTWTEAAFTGYARKIINASDLNAATGTAPPQTTNANAISFAACTGGSSTVVGWAIVDNLSGTGGNILWFGAVSSQVVSSGIIFNIAIGGLVLQLPEASGLSDYAAKKLLDHSVGKASYTMPTSYFALCTASSATAYTEASYTGYASGAVRVSATAQLAASSGNAPAVSTNSGGDIVFPASTGGTPTVTNFVLIDSQTYGAGNILWYGTTTSQAIVSGNTPVVQASTLTLNLT